MKTLFSRQVPYVLLAMVAGLLLTPVDLFAMASDAGPPQPYERVTIVHTNDIQGHFIPSEATWLGEDTPPKVGGIASYATFLKEEQRQATHENRGLLVLDGGDWFTGTPESDLTGGRAMITALNQIPLDFTTIGNHEFDVGPKDLVDRVEDLKHPVLASNIRYRSDTMPFPGTSDTAIVQRQGIKFGLFSLLLDEMPEITIPSSIEGVRFQDEQSRARAMVNQLKGAGADVIVALTHMGLEQDRKLAKQFRKIDVIIGGHSHTRLEEPRLINETIVAQAGSDLTATGRIDLDLNTKTGEVIGYQGGLVSLYHDRYPPDTGVKNAVEPYVRKAEEKLSESIGRAVGDIERSSAESSPLGNLITDAMREYTGADVAVQNAYGIRSGLPAGDITLNQLHQILPFGNKLVEMTLTGRQLQNVFEQSASLEKGLLQFSGATVRIDVTREPGNRVERILVDGSPIKPDKPYRIVTNSFLSQGGDKFTTFRKGTDRQKYPATTLRDALKGYIETHTPLSPPVEERYEITGEITSSR